VSEHITFVCQWYPPEPVAVPESIVQALTLGGLKVDVLTGVPHFPTGHVLDGHRAWELSRSDVRGVRVQRTPEYPSHDSNALRRVLTYTSWAVSSAFLGQRALRRSDVLLVYSSPATAAFPAMVAKKLWGVPYVLLIQDVWPDSIFSSGFLNGKVTRFAHFILNHFVNLTYRMADRIAVISPGMIELLHERGVPRGKMSVVYNWVPSSSRPVSEHQAATRDLLRNEIALLDNAPLFLYAGNHGGAQGLESLIDAFADETSAPAHLVLMGDGVRKRELIARAHDNPRVHFLDRVSRTAAMRFIEAADVSVVSLADMPLFAVTMPSKVQAGLASGQCMLVTARGDAADAIASAGAGLTADPGDPGSIAMAVRELSERTDSERRVMGEAGRRYYNENMAEELGTRKLIAILRRAAESNRKTLSRRKRSHHEPINTC
jgi:colanic acid biosynthesis glycosyl transferase WcaI